MTRTEAKLLPVEIAISFAASERASATFQQSFRCTLEFYAPISEKFHRLIGYLHPSEGENNCNETSAYLNGETNDHLIIF
ncbi:MAG TPA: hypothetical protein DCP92_18950 [Nitrospiraceae bacterium]|jgi:hypothetical protein|nr:hypothetical protein [Nitrospiraceae bacterium]